MIGLVVAKPLLQAAGRLPRLTDYAHQIEGLISGLLVALLAYVLFRMLQVVRGDRDLTELQARFVVRAVERKQADRFAKQRENSLPFTQPPDFGKPLQ
jgi:hypothetical protein